MFNNPTPFKVVEASKSLTDVDCFGSMWTRFKDSSTRIQQKRFIDSVISYATAASEQAGFRERRTWPSVKEYIALRRRTGAVQVIQQKALNFLDSSLTGDTF